MRNGKKLIKTYFTCFIWPMHSAFVFRFQTGICLSLKSTNIGTESSMLGYLISQTI